MIKVITVNYKQEKYIEKLVDSLDDDVELYIVDNSGELLNKRYAKTTILDPTKNIGYLKGLAFGTKMIDIKDDDFIIWTNPDITFDERFFEILKKNPGNDYDMLAPSIINSDGQDQNPNMVTQASWLRIAIYDLEYSSYVAFAAIRALRNFLKFFIGNKIKKSNVIKRKKIFLGHGACMIFNGIFFSFSHDFDYDIFTWGEEAIIAYEVRRRGGKVIYEPSLTVYHEEGSITSSIPNRQKYITTSKSYKIYRQFLRATKH